MQMRILVTSFCLTMSGLYFSADRLPLIAVMPISTKALDANAVETITDALASELVNTGAVRVMERSEMQRILAEQSLGASGACDSADCTMQLGRLLAVDQIVAGSVGRIGNTYSFSARLVSVKTGEIVKAVTRNGAAETDKLLSELVPAVASGLVGTSTAVRHSPTPKAQEPQPVPEPSNRPDDAAVPRKTRFRLTPLAGLGTTFSSYGDSLYGSPRTISANGGGYAEIGARFEWTPNAHMGLGLENSIGIENLNVSGTFTHGNSTSSFNDDMVVYYDRIGARFEWKWSFGLFAATGLAFVVPLTGTENYKLPDTSYSVTLDRVTTGDSALASPEHQGILSWTEWNIEVGWVLKSGWRFGGELGVGLSSFNPGGKENSGGELVYSNPRSSYARRLHRFGFTVGRSFSF